MHKSYEIDCYNEIFHSTYKSLRAITKHKTAKLIEKQT